MSLQQSLTGNSQRSSRATVRPAPQQREPSPEPDPSTWSGWFETQFRKVDVVGEKVAWALGLTEKKFQEEYDYVKTLEQQKEEERLEALRIERESTLHHELVEEGLTPLYEYRGPERPPTAAYTSMVAQPSEN